MCASDARPQIRRINEERRSITESRTAAPTKDMSRQTSQRNLTLPEELEKLEQSITLTLQEIDSNFSKAHRIVTTSILPIVEQYAKHSNDVWEGSKVCSLFCARLACLS